MENKDEPAAWDTGAGHLGDDQRQPAPGVSGAVFGRGAPVPDTVLVAEMADGSLFLHGWRDGPSAYLMVEDAGPLRRELAVAFGSADAPTPDVSGEPR